MHRVTNIFYADNLKKEQGGKKIMENLACFNEPKIDLETWLKKRRRGVKDGQKFVKRFYGLECDLLVRTAELTHEDWLEARKLGITGTDIGGILDINKYTSPMKIYLDKLGALEPTEDNEAMYWGRTMEEVIAREFQTRNSNMKVNKVNVMLKHPMYDWALANIDRLIISEYGERGILEIKTVSEYGKDAWEAEEVPPQYMVQIQWYMFVANVRYGYFAALIGGNKYVQKYVERDDELIEMLLSTAQGFWMNNVLKKVPPSLDGSEALSNLLKTLYPTSVPGAELILPEEAAELIETREDLKGKSKELDEQIAECENKLKDLLRENEIGFCGDKKVIWKSSSRTTVDSKTLKSKYPQIYEECSKTLNTRTFSIK
jgi:putative phage-type endonuclease